MVKVLVIGATGYLGLSIAQALRRSSHLVWGMSRSQLKAAFLASQEITPVVGDIANPAVYLKIIETEAIDTIIDASATYDGAHAVLKSIIGAGEARLKTAGPKSPKLGYIYISGMWIHGSSIKPVNDLSPVGKAHSYSQPPKMLSWRPALEDEILAASGTLNVGIIRPALMYGKNQSAFGIYFGPMIHAASSNESSLSLPASATTILPLVHVDDCAESVRYLLEHLEIVNGQGTLPVFDVVASSESMRSVLERAAILLGFRGNIEFSGPGEDMMAEAMCTEVRGDSSRAQALLGWVPRKKPMLEELEIHIAAFLASMSGDK